MFRHAGLSRITAALAIASMAALAGCSSSGSSTSAVAARTAEPVEAVKKVSTPRTANEPTRTGEVYLMRGLMDIFSRGMDEMAIKINRAGVYAMSTSYTEWQNLADQIVKRDRAKEVSYPVVIMGHSLGANDASKMATYLGNRGVKVSYVVMFDPTEPGSVGKNVGKVVNYYIPNGDNRVYKGEGFTGTLQNVSVANREEITHTTIEKNRDLQNRVISQVIAITKVRPKAKDEVAKASKPKAKTETASIATTTAKPKSVTATTSAATTSAPKTEAAATTAVPAKAKTEPAAPVVAPAKPKTEAAVAIPSVSGSATSGPAVPAKPAAAPVTPKTAPTTGKEAAASTIKPATAG